MPARLPNFLFIGPDKSGSTWLYDALKQHRLVFLPRVKELFFFDRFYDKGWGWYLRFFKEAGEHHRVVGETCHDYLFSPLACRRIAQDLPSVRLMVCLREPGQRAFSEYLYMLKLGLLTCDFETALAKLDFLIDHGRYSKHLSPYLQRFPRNQIYIAVFDDLASDPQQFFDGICDFLSLPQASLPSELREKVLPAAKPRLRKVAKLARRISLEVRRWGLPGVVARFKESTLLSRILYRAYEPEEKPEMSPQTRRYLHEIFSPELQQLDALLGTRFGARWGYPELEFPRAVHATPCMEAEKFG